MRRAIDVAKTKFKPETVTYLSRSAGERGNVEDIARSLFQEDLRDIAVQEELIEKYLSDYSPEEETLKKVFEMNKKYNNLAEKEEETIRNVNWKLKKVEWDNLFNYGECNVINFENLNGIVGILGKNFSGKSSIIDSFLYTLYNTTSKNNRKNLNLINQNEESCRGYVEIDIGTKTYKIERFSKKYKKKLKGKETFEAKTDVEFSVLDSLSGEEESFNGITRIETDNNIRKIFGTIDDFLLTSMASQLDSLSYLNEGSTKRKEILAKFLDLQLFDKKFKMCNEDSVDLKGAIKKLSGENYEETEKQARTDLARSQAALSALERSCAPAEQVVHDISLDLDSVNQNISSMPQEIVEYKDSRDKIFNCQRTIQSLEKNQISRSYDLEENCSLLAKIDNFLQGFDIDFYNERKDDINEKQNQLSEIISNISISQEKKKDIDNKIDSLKRAPCSFDLKRKCHFVKDANRALDDAKRVQIDLNQLTLSKKTLDKKISELNSNKVSSYISKYYSVLEKKTSLKEEISRLELDSEKDKVKM